MCDKGGFLLFSAVAEAVSALIAAAEPHKDEGQQAFAVAKLIENPIERAAAAAEYQKDNQNPKTAVVVVAKA